MTDRYDTITVALDERVREYDLEPLIEAIEMLNGVAGAEPTNADGMELHRLRNLKENELHDAIRRIMNDG